MTFELHRFLGHDLVDTGWISSIGNALSRPYQYAFGGKCISVIGNNLIDARTAWSEFREHHIAMGLIKTAAIIALLVPSILPTVCFKGLSTLLAPKPPFSDMLQDSGSSPNRSTPIPDASPKKPEEQAQTYFYLGMLHPKQSSDSPLVSSSVPSLILDASKKNLAEQVRQYYLDKLKNPTHNTTVIIEFPANAAPQALCYHWARKLSTEKLCNQVIFTNAPQSTECSHQTHGNASPPQEYTSLAEALASGTSCCCVVKP